MQHESGKTLISDDEPTPQQLDIIQNKKSANYSNKVPSIKQPSIKKCWWSCDSNYFQSGVQQYTPQKVYNVCLSFI